MNKNKDEKKKLELNTYCIFADNKQKIDETIGFIFKDYIKKLKNNT